MKRTELIMGMPITIEILDKDAGNHFTQLFNYFKDVDARYSTYKKTSEISKINRGLVEDKWSQEMRQVIKLCEQTRRDTLGYFDIMHNGQLDPSGLVKGWAVHNAAKMLHAQGANNFYIEAGGDIQVRGKAANGQPWTVGIRNPFNLDEIIKILSVSSEGVATSGTYIRGQHIYDPHEPNAPIKHVKSLTVVAKNVYEADRFATAAFAMGSHGIDFIESLDGFEGYMVTKDKKAIFTSGFEKYALNA